MSRLSLPGQLLQLYLERTEQLAASVPSTCGGELFTEASGELPT